jgi:hypothetical protein
VNDAFLPPDFRHFGSLAGQNARDQDRMSCMKTERLAAIDQLDG